MINYDVAVRLMRGIKIFNQNTSKLESWTPNDEQLVILRALIDSRRVITLKARQIGSTSVHAYYVALAAFANPNTPVAVLNFSYSESKNILRRIKAFLVQLGTAFATENATELILSNGSSITAITAVSAIDGESKAGRGRSYKIVYSSETAYYRDSAAVFASISAALTTDGSLYLESTATPGYGTFRYTWQEGTEYTKLFFGIEAHKAYQKPDDQITDSRWLELQNTYGFNSRPHAAWWDNKLTTDLAGDERRALREYPVLPEHSWTSADGRWINTDPQIRQYQRDPLHSELKLYDQPDSSHYYVASIDTALGAGGDDSVIIIYDCYAKRIAASYCHNGAPIDVVVELAKSLHTKYKPKLWYIENNGIGTATVLLARQANLPVHEINTNHSNRSVGMLWARKQILAGLAADENLLENCRSCTVQSTATGDKFSGRKDFLLALAFIGQQEQGWAEDMSKPPPKVYAPDAFRADSLISRALKQNRGRR